MGLDTWKIRSDFPLAVVTGGAHRLGKAFSLELAKSGYATLIHYNEALEEATKTAEEVRELGAPAFLHQADLKEDGGVSSLVGALDALMNDESNHLSGLRVLINSAAIMPRGDARALSAAEWDTTMALNLRAPFLLSQAAARRMTEGGLIVNVSDVAGQKAWSGFPVYSVSKAGLDSLTRVLARAFAPSIRVNAIAPGLVLPSGDLSPEEWYRLTARVPLKRPATADEIARALEFLLQNEYVTGQIIAIDGGYSLV